LNHENYETNPKQYLRILFKGNGFAQFWLFFCSRKEPKTPWTVDGGPGQVVVWSDMKRFYLAPEQPAIWPQSPPALLRGFPSPDRPAPSLCRSPARFAPPAPGRNGNGEQRLGIVIAGAPWTAAGSEALRPFRAGSRSQKLAVRASAAFFSSKNSRCQVSKNQMANHNSMKTIATLAAASLMALAAGSGRAADENKLVTANTAFAFNLFQQVSQEQPNANVFLSPFSVSSALQMTVNGAGGATRAEMEQTLGTTGIAAPALNAAFLSLNRDLESRQGVTLNLANGIWYQKGAQFKPAFGEMNRKYFHAEIAGVDFLDPHTAALINDWADRQTQGKVKAVVQYPFPEQTRLVLANAVYFKGKWEKAFPKRATHPRDFHLANGSVRQTPMMSEGGPFEYQAQPGFQAVKLPYQGGFQMELYLPAPDSNPSRLLADLAQAGSWREKIQSGFQREEGSVTLPKFKIEDDMVLNGALKTLGMKTAFSKSADFTGIADGGLWISLVKQKSYVDVYEEGTEAAAVTTVTMAAAVMRMPPPDRFNMVLDRPFIFVISDVASGSILFMGIANDPVSGG
jgi:serpin B